MNGQIVWDAVKRLDIGGKLLTNQLKELISFRQWNMMDETYIMNDVKEACCYVSTDFEQDLETCRADPKTNPVVREYILPDLSINRKGRIRGSQDIVTDADQILVMNNERFSVPEIIFRPDNLGMNQCGLADTIAVSISLLPEDLRGMFWANIGLIGGNTKFPGFRRRLLAELRSRAPVDAEVVIYDCEEPTTEVYRSALAFARSPQFTQNCVTREEYAESGSNASRRKFSDWKVTGATEKDAATKGTRDTAGKEKAGRGPRGDERVPQGAMKKLSRTRSKVVNAASSAPATSRRRG
ncbi:hypothetical protein HGRIS_006458 [Hohenbuehelia grisea]|uniref:Uncharacterized protein n=1 Tax=Hohenbuehelia grisea TaxID=104357 RepID=A0ABR3K2W6_9AGAR